MITVSYFLPKYHASGWVNESFFFFWFQLIQRNVKIDGGT